MPRRRRSSPSRRRIAPQRSRAPLAVAICLFAAASAAVALGVASAPHHPGARSHHHNAAAPKASAPAPAAPAALQQALTAAAARYGEPVGIAVMDTRTGWLAQVDGRSIYPQQSVSKLWTALTILEKVDQSQLRLTDSFVMGPQDRSVFPLSTDPVIGPNGYPITLTQLLERAIENSDNAANDKLMTIAGGAPAIRAELQHKHLSGIEIGGPERDLQAEISGMTWQSSYGLPGVFKDVRAKLPASTRDAAMARYLADPADGATPVGLVRALAALQRGELLSPATRQTLLQLMSQVRTGPMRLKGGLSQGWTIGHKTGTGQDWRGGSIGINDVGLLTAPDGHTYAVAVMIRRTTKPVPERMALMQTVAREVVASWQTASGIHTAPVAPPTGGGLAGAGD